MSIYKELEDSLVTQQREEWLRQMEDAAKEGERTQEIGLRKAMGATERQISTQFLAEVLAARVRAAVSAKSTYDTIKRMNSRLQELHDTAFQFVDNVSHEFRTPLTVIKEFSSIVRDGIAGTISRP